MKHNYILKSMFTDTDYSQAHHNDIMLLQGNQPWIFNPRLVVLTDAYRHLQPEAFSFVEDCYDKTIVGTLEKPAVFTYTPTKDITPEECAEVHCYWNGTTFHLETICKVADYNILINYIPMTAEDEDVIFLPIAKWFYGMKYGDTQERLFTNTLFDTYQNAKIWTDQFLRHHGKKLKFHTIDIMVLPKKELDSNIWYHMQKDILIKTRGYSPAFESQFRVHGKRMYYNLFGEDALKALTERCKKS